MTFPLPRQVAYPAASWSVVDFVWRTYRTPNAAAGVAEVSGDQLGIGEMWSIQRAVVSSTSTTPSACWLYDANVDPSSLLSATDSGNYDEAEYPLGLLLGQSRTLLAHWTGISDGAVGTIRLQVAVMRQATS